MTRIRRCGLCSPATSAAARSTSAGSPRRLARHLIGVSAVFLLVGVVAPMLTVVAQAEVTLLGEVVLKHESRSILGTVRHLASDGNLAVASLLFLFSVLIPVAKLLLSWLALGGVPGASRRRAIRGIRLIGRWSMTDVFVVAVLLAFLSTESKSFTDASLGPGLYFFAGYGLLSLLGGQLLMKMEAEGDGAG